MKQKANSLIWYSLLLFVFILPISAYVSTRVVVVVLLISLFVGIRSFKFLDILKSSWDILLYFSIISIGLLYSSDLASGLRTLETSFALLALSIISHRIYDFSRDHLNKIFLYFSFGIFVAGLICLLKAIFTYSIGGYNTDVFFFYDFTTIIKSHPTYFAYYLIFAITYGLYVLNYEKSQFSIVAIVGFVLFCFCTLLLTGGQTAFIAILFIFAFFILKFFLDQNEYRQRITLVLVSVMLGSIVFVSSAIFPQRNQELNDSWDRFDLWRSAILANSDPILGVGTGDSKSALNEYFLKTNQDSFAAQGLNAHNQFIQILFSNGIFGLLSVLILILRPLYLAFKNNDQMGILMIFPFLIYGMTEVFLGRYQGVVFFALLHQVFISHYLSSKKLTQVNGVLA
jgi:O-antigen ligase